MSTVSAAASAILRTALFSLLVGACDASAQTWTGAGADNNWSTGANWSGGVAPASSIATQLSFPASARFAPVVDAPWTVSGVAFTANYQLSGQTVTFAGTAPLITLGVFNVGIANPIVLASGLNVSTLGFLNFDGSIAGNGPLTVSGNGGVMLNGANTFTGALVVAGGAAVVVNGSLAGPANVGDASILGGTGTISGPVGVAGPHGSLDPGSGGPGVLTTGDVAIAGALGVSVSGPVRGTGYSGLDVDGTVNLAGASLGLIGSYVPVPGDVLLLIENDGSDAISGNFAALPEAATIDFNGVPLRISYKGGTGNDVTLTALSPSPMPVPALSQWALVVLATMVIGVGLRARLGRG